MSCLQATIKTLRNRRGELLIESVLAIALLAILFATVLLMITTSLNMVNEANANAAAQQATVDSLTTQQFASGNHNVVIQFQTDAAGVGGSVGGWLAETDGFAAFTGG